MAIDPLATVEKAQQLDLLAAQQVPTGVTEALTGPALGQDEPFQVAGGGGVLRTILQARRLIKEKKTEPPPAPRPEPGLEPTPDPRPDPEISPAPELDVPPTVAKAPPEPILSDAAMDARVKNQGRISVTEEDASDVLRNILEPRRTDSVSDGLPDFRIEGARGDVKIPDEGSIRDTLAEIAGRYSDEIAEGTRGVVTHEVTQELADLMGADPKALLNAAMNMRTTGGVSIVEGFGLSETVLAIRNLLYTELSKLDALAELAVVGKSTDLLNFRQQFELVSNLHANFKGVQTEIGRALGIFRKPIHHGHRPIRDTNLATMLDEFGGQGDITDLANAYLDLPTSAQRLQFSKVSKWRKFTNAAFEVWLNMLLSGPVTHTKNFVAAGMTIFLETPVHLTAATIGTARRAVGGEGGETYGEVWAMMFGQIMAAREAVQLAGTTFRTGELPIAGSKLEITANAGDRRANAFSAEAFEISRATKAGNILAIGVDAIGHFLTFGRIPTRALGFEDTVWKVVSSRGDLWRQAYRGAREQGLKGDEAAQFMANFMADPPASAIKESGDLARLLTLQQPLESKLGKWVSTGARIGPMRWFIPFVKTPYNAFAFAFEHTPLAPLTKNFRDAMSSGNPSVQNVAMARVSLGSLFALSIGSMTAAGQITGGGPSDPGLRAALDRKDWEPYSILIDGKYYSYAGAEPYSTIIGIVADAVELVQTGLMDQDEADEILTGIVFSLGKNLSNKTFMQGFSNFMNAVTNGDRHAGRVVEGFVSSAVPGLVRQLARATDPYRRDPVEFQSMPRDYRELPMELQQRYSNVLARYDTWAWLNSRIGEIQANIPGWGEKLPALRDFWGRPIMNEGAFGPEPMSPIYMSVADTTEMEIDGKIYDTGFLDEEMLRLKISYKGHPDDYAGFPMSGEERDYFQERAGMWAVKLISHMYAHPNNRRLREKGITQRHTSASNEHLKLLLRKAVKHARDNALTDLMRHETLGRGFFESLQEFRHLQTTMKRMEMP